MCSLALNLMHDNELQGSLIHIHDKQFAVVVVIVVIL
jgi:hypothetical protein